jgi:hypothetical protein
VGSFFATRPEIIAESIDDVHSRVSFSTISETQHGVWSSVALLEASDEEGAL